MAVTVEDLLQLAFPQGSEVVGGRAGLKRQVVWARSLRPRLPAFEALEGGEMALISSSQLSMLQESMTLAYVISRLAEVGVSAVAVLGDVDAEAIEVADCTEIPLIRLPSGCSLVEVERSAIATVVDRQAELQARASEIHRQLAQITFEERGLQAVVDRLAEITRRSVVIEDEQFRVQFAAAGPDIPHPEEMDLRAGREAVESWIAGVPLSGAQPPVAKFPIAGSGLARFVAPIPARDGVAGYLSAIAEPNSLTELDRLAVGRGAAVCAVEVAKEAAIGEAEARVRGDLLDQLLSDGMDADQAVLGKARRLGYDPTVPSLAMAFRPESRERAGTAYRGVERARRQLESAVRVELTRREARSLVAARGASVVAVIPLQLAPTEKAANDLAEMIRSRAEAAMEGWRVAAGVGRPTQSHGGLVTSYREAEGALSIGMRVNGPSSTTYFGDLGILRLLAQVVNSAELESFRMEMLGRLEEHDQKAGGELLKTLEALFRCHGNLSRTAEQLSLHRNSLLYRLQRIEEISGLELDDPEVRLSLQVALKVRQLLEAERAGRG